MTETGTYRIELDRFSGPMDLLLHLLREDELDPVAIPVARICDQYLAYLEGLDRIELDAAGDFLVMASTLLRLKSQALLPGEEQVLDDEDLDPRFDLVRQLIQYRRFKRVADLLAARREDAARRFPRGMHPELADQPRPTRPLDAGEADVESLFRAFARMLREIRPATDYVVTFDETPLEVHIARLEGLIDVGSTHRFRDLLPDRVTRSYAIGVFLALLDLLKRARVDVRQDEPLGPILVTGVPEPLPEPQEPARDQTPPREEREERDGADAPRGAV